MGAEVCEYFVDGPLGIDFYKFSLGFEDFEYRHGFLLSYFKSLLNSFNVIVDSARNFGPLQQSCLHNGLSNFKTYLTAHQINGEWYICNVLHLCEPVLIVFFISGESIN